MAEPQAASLPPSAKLGLGQCFLSGKIAYSRSQKTEHGRIHLTILKLAAADEFSHPSTVEVSSENKLGEVDETWKGVCAVTGYPRSFNGKPDPETGEIKTIRTATINLRVVE
jgi:hypothetical protein